MKKHASLVKYQGKVEVLRLYEEEGEKQNKYGMDIVFVLKKMYVIEV